MKFLRVGSLNREKPAIIEEDGIIRDLSSVISDLNSTTINQNTIEKIKKINLNKLPEINENIRIGPCVANPEKFIGIGLNYSDHAEETGMKPPSEPIIFIKANSCICGPNDNVIIPKNSKKTDWEIELGIVIGKKAQYISEDKSLEYIFGYCIVNDISEREFQIERSGGQWDKGKGCDTFGPIGPYLVTKNEIKNIQDLNLELKLNGKITQKGNTNKMIFGVKHIVSYLSHFMTLNPGDIITTGTPPGVGMARNPQIFLKPGDEMILNIDNLGSQKQKVISMK
ncbi:MAG: fumarylacetoacetate hydrolase family protein [Pelagibacterales bacterium]|jgi:2-keto-4-pentenoate hydratase/2-oxohepta-3-ene-1,7-dioic acid hydratase in catechol pathway|nr:fumarylacetoacetate hydrolase family protein [Pelagibacterales bacterium]